MSGKQPWWRRGTFGHFLTVLGHSAYVIALLAVGFLLIWLVNQFADLAGGDTVPGVADGRQLALQILYLLEWGLYPVAACFVISDLAAIGYRLAYSTWKDVTTQQA